MPAPAGRSRESSIVLDRDGRFRHDGERFSHQGLQRGFAQWIRRHPDDGRFILCNGYDWCYFTVEDTPYFVSAVLSGEHPPQIELFDGSRELLDAATLRVGTDGVLRVAVKQGVYQARFSRHAQVGLMPLLCEDEQDEEQMAIEIDGRRYPIAVEPSPERS